MFLIKKKLADVQYLISNFMVRSTIGIGGTEAAFGDVLQNTCS